eukprot:CFRG3706T1
MEERTLTMSDLQRAVFDVDVKRAELILSSASEERVKEWINALDSRGNTLCHVAIWKGSLELVELCLKYGARTRIKSRDRWTPLDEAVSMGDRDVIRLVYTAYMKQVEKDFQHNMPNLLRGIRHTGDFVLTLDWRVNTWLPLISRIRLCDTYTITKKGTNVRVDTTLTGFNEYFMAERGNVSYIFKLEGDDIMAQDKSFIVMDNIKHCYNIARSKVKGGRESAPGSFNCSTNGREKNRNGSRINSRHKASASEGSLRISDKASCVRISRNGSIRSERSWDAAHSVSGLRVCASVYNGLRNEDGNMNLSTGLEVLPYSMGTLAAASTNLHRSASVNNGGRASAGMTALSACRSASVGGTRASTMPSSSFLSSVGGGSSSGVSASTSCGCVHTSKMPRSGSCGTIPLPKRLGIHEEGLRKTQTPVLSTMYLTSQCIGSNTSTLATHTAPCPTISQDLLKNREWCSTLPGMNVMGNIGISNDIADRNHRSSGATTASPTPNMPECIARDNRAVSVSKSKSCVATPVSNCDCISRESRNVNEGSTRPESFNQYLQKTYSSNSAYSSTSANSINTTSSTNPLPKKKTSLTGVESSTPCGTPSGTGLRGMSADESRYTLSPRQWKKSKPRKGNRPDSPRLGSTERSMCRSSSSCQCINNYSVASINTNVQSNGAVSQVGNYNKSNSSSHTNMKTRLCNSSASNNNSTNRETRAQEKARVMEDELDLLMRNYLSKVNMCTKSITFERAKAGLWGMRHDRTDMINGMHADVYDVKNVCLRMRKRMEHLSEEDIKSQKQSRIKTADFAQEARRNSITDKAKARRWHGVSHRNSLPPPEKCDATFDEYISSNIYLGRPIRMKERRKEFGCHIWMSEDFPMKFTTLCDLLEIVAPTNKYFLKIRELLSASLPPGFPVRIEIPLLPTVSATVTFKELVYQEIEDSIFTYPPDYKRDPSMRAPGFKSSKD